MKLLHQVVKGKNKGRVLVSEGEELGIEEIGKSYRIAQVVPSQEGIWSLLAYRRKGDDIEKIIYREGELVTEQITNSHRDYWNVDAFLRKFEKSPSEQFREFLALQR